MDLDPRIQHLDETSPFDAIDALDVAIALARQAFAQHVRQTPMQEAKSSDCETYFVDALGHLWAAREDLHACVEALDA